MNISRCRRAYRAMVAKLGIDDDARRDFNESLTGHRSSKDFSETHWRVVVSELQRLTGRQGVRVGQPHLRGERPRRRDLPYPLDAGATPEQVAYMRDLAAQIAWHHPDGQDAGLRELICQRAFVKAEETMRDQWKRGCGTLEGLPREVASRAIHILHRMVAARERADATV